MLVTGPLEALGPLAFAQEEVKWRGERKKAKEWWGKRGYRSTEEQTRRASRTPAHSRPVCPTAPQRADVCVCIRETAYVCADILMEVKLGLHSSTHRWLSLTLPQGTTSPIEMTMRHYDNHIARL